MGKTISFIYVPPGTQLMDNDLLVPAIDPDGHILFGSFERIVVEMGGGNDSLNFHGTPDTVINNGINTSSLLQRH